MTIKMKEVVAIDEYIDGIGDYDCLQERISQELKSLLPANDEDYQLVFRILSNYLYTNGVDIHD